MEILKVDGRLLRVTPANNLFGRGFYQFSPEVFFRLFSDANGFEVERMIAAAWESFSDEYEGPHHTSGNGQGGKASIKDALRAIAHRIARILPSANPFSRSILADITNIVRFLIVSSLPRLYAGQHGNQVTGRTGKIDVNLLAHIVT